jgi:hypothetical protein
LWWERFWQLVALAITLAAVVTEGLVPLITWAFEGS